jgi:hypothetical protein
MGVSPNLGHPTDGVHLADSGIVLPVVSYIIQSEPPLLVSRKGYRWKSHSSLNPQNSRLIVGEVDYTGTDERKFKSEFPSSVSFQHNYAVLSLQVILDFQLDLCWLWAPYIIRKRLEIYLKESTFVRACPILKQKLSPDSPLSLWGIFFCSLIVQYPVFQKNLCRWQGKTQREFLELSLKLTWRKQDILSTCEESR